MKLANKVINDKLSISEDCDLAVLNNVDKNSITYNRTFERIKKVIIKEFEEDNFEFTEVDIHAEIHHILELYNQ